VTEDDDAEDGAPRSGPPLPPDDRLWRHPSELGNRSAVTPVPPPPSRPATRGSARWLLAVVAGLTGAVLATGALAVTGQMSPDVAERAVIEKVAVTPVVSSPMVRGERGVVAVAERLSPAIVRLDVERDDGPATGSGVLFRDDGLILTSAHVVAATTAITVVLTDGRRLEGQLVGLDVATDTALVDLEGTGYPVAVLGTATGLEVGAPTIAIGSPLGFEGGPSVTTGVISAVARRVESVDGEPLHGMIQTDAPIAPGSSGGALVDASGAVIGIVTAVAEEPGSGFGFATPIDLAHRVAAQLLHTGEVVHAWLGIHGADLTPAQAAVEGVRGGAVVRDVAAGSPAATAGLVAGDVISDLGGTRVRTTSALVVALREHGPGDAVTIVWWRDGHRHEAMVSLAARP
jgi:S1-C subfamily serine protease